MIVEKYLKIYSYSYLAPDPKTYGCMVCVHSPVCVEQVPLRNVTLFLWFNKRNPLLRKKNSLKSKNKEQSKMGWTVAMGILLIRWSEETGESFWLSDSIQIRFTMQCLNDQIWNMWKLGLACGGRAEAEIARSLDWVGMGFRVSLDWFQSFGNHKFWYPFGWSLEK